MIKQQQKNRLLILLLFGMTIIPFLIALVFKENPELLAGRTNNGQLVIPPVVTDRSEVSGYDPVSAEHIEELKGHWLIVNVIPESSCNAICLDAIHKTRQLQLMLSKDLTRTRRAVMIFGHYAPTDLDKSWLEDKTLLKLKPELTLINKINKIESGQVPDGILFLMDPLGNLMMRYESGFDPYKVKSDLTHLLRISQIG